MQLNHSASVRSRKCHRGHGRRGSWPGMLPTVRLSSSRQESQKVHDECLQESQRATCSLQRLYTPEQDKQRTPSFMLAASEPKISSTNSHAGQYKEPYVTLDSRSSLIRTTFGVHTSFFPSSHLRVSRTPRTFEGYLKNIVSQIRCAARRDNMCLLSPSKGIK